MLENGNRYSGRILKRNNGSAAGADNASEKESGSLADNASLSPQEIREMVLAEAQRDADEMRKKRMAELDGEVERAVATHVMQTTKELNLGLASANADIARIVEASLRRITGQMDDGKLIDQIVRQAIKERNARNKATVTVSKEDYPKLKIIMLGASSKDEQWVELIEDESMAEGRVILSVNGKQFDISLETQILAIRSAMQLDVSTLETRVSA